MSRRSFWDRIRDAAARIAGYAQDLKQELRDEIGEAVREARQDVEQRKVARDPATRRLTDGLLEWYEGLARPALFLRPDPAAPLAGAGARLGGDLWLAPGEQWPLGADGRRLEYIASLDFAVLPPLAGFPTAGRLRFFVGLDDLHGMNFDDPAKGDIRLLWHDGPSSDGRYEKPATLEKDDLSPFNDTEVRRDGLALTPTPASDPPDYYSWQVSTHLDAIPDSPASQYAQDQLFERTQERPFAHHIGGHPSFTQYDVRKPGFHDDYDTVLLALTSDDNIMWGDVGEAAFLIRQDDLDRRDFSRVMFTWDCH